MLKLQKVTFFRAWSGALKMVRGGGVTDSVTVAARPRAKIGAGTSALIRCITLSSKVTAPDAVEGGGVVAVEFASSSSGVWRLYSTLWPRYTFSIFFFGQKFLYFFGV